MTTSNQRTTGHDTGHRIPASDTATVSPTTMTTSLSCLLFVVILAGQFSFARIGVDNPVYIPERLFALIVLAYIVGVIHFARRSPSRSAPTAVLAIATPVLYFTVTAAWSPPNASISETLTDLTCILLEITILVTLLKWDATKVAETFLWCMMIVGFTFSLAGVSSASLGSRIAAFGGGPNVYSRITMLGFVALIGLITSRRIPLVAASIAPLMIAATILSGSRGGMLSGLVSILFLAPLIRRFTGKQLIALALTTFAFACAVYWRYGAFLQDTVNNRIVDLTVHDHYTSGRNQLLSYAWGMFQQRPVTGWGLNGFATQYQQGFTYPHNVAVQAAAEGGIFGLATLAVALVAFLVATLRTRDHNHAITYRSAGMLIFTASMFSGGYYDARFFFIFAIIAVWHATTPGQTRNTHGD